MNRREFLKKSTIGGTGLGMALSAAPAVFSAPADTINPSDKITVGCIGVGARAQQLMESIMQCDGTEIVTVCDAYKGRVKRSIDRCGGKPTAAKDYKEIINRSDIDAVVIATPDHWHKTMAIEALQAGKDVYIEKPMTYTVEDGSAIIDAVKRTNRVLQVGSQGMSSKIQIKAREIIASGKLGQITMIRASYNRNTASGAWIYPIPPDAKDLSQSQVDWEMFLGPAPKRPYDAARFFQWRCFRDYSGGIATDLFVHLCTTIHFLMGVKAPASVIASGQLYRWKETRDVPDTLNAIFTYNEGFTVNMSSTFNNQLSKESGFEILGTEGSISIGSNRVLLTTEKAIEDNKWIVDSWPKEMEDAYYRDKKIQKEEVPSLWEPEVNQVQQTFEETGLDATTLHFWNFFEAVRTKKQPLEDVYAGHRAAACAHMVNKSVETNKIVYWDAQKDTMKM